MKDKDRDGKERQESPEGKVLGEKDRHAIPELISKISSKDVEKKAKEI